MHIIHVATPVSVRNSVSIQFETASIPFALHGNFPGSGLKVDRFNRHTVGGLK